MTAPWYTDGQVTLYQGDCLDLPQWLAADVLVTDPPYGIDHPGGTMYRDYHNQPAWIAGDQDTTLRDCILTMWDGQGPVVMFGSWRQPRPANVSQRLIWHKKEAYPGLRTSAYYPAEEEIYLIGNHWQGPPRQNVIATSELRSGHNGLIAEIGHPMPKPLPLMRILISKCAPGIIADPCAGSGSTLIAARDEGRQAIGVEIDPAYCDLIVRRLGQTVLF